MSLSRPRLTFAHDGYSSPVTEGSNTDSSTPCYPTSCHAASDDERRCSKKAVATRAMNGFFSLFAIQSM